MLPRTLPPSEPRKTYEEVRVAGRSSANVFPASTRPNWTMSGSGNAAPESACSTCCGVAVGNALSSSATRPATTGLAEEVPQNAPYPPESSGATLQPGAATRTHGPKFDHE